MGGLVDRVSSGVWAVAAGASVVVAIATWSVARRRLHRAGKRVASPQLVPSGGRVRDSALTRGGDDPRGAVLEHGARRLAAGPGRFRPNRSGLAGRLGVPGPRHP